MTFKASIENQKLGESVEDEIFMMLKRMLPDAFVTRGSNDPRENGKYGDVYVRKTSYEAPLVLIEAKGSTYPGSFSLSDYEKRVSQAKWVIVKGSMGIWAIEMRIARDFLTEKGDAGDKYWVCEPPWREHESIATVIADICAAFVA